MGSNNTSKPKSRSDFSTLFSKLFKRQQFELYSKEKPDISDYLKERLKHQIDWYEDNAVSNMKRFYLGQIVIIVVSAIIPVINVYDFPNDSSIVDISIRLWSSVLGGTIAISTGFIQLTKAQEKWILYRSTAESLKREYTLFSLDSGEEYAQEKNPEEKKVLFINRCESIMAVEGTKYVATQRTAGTGQS
jgi:hypothetical protein